MCLGSDLGPDDRIHAGELDDGQRIQHITDLNRAPPSELEKQWDEGSGGRHQRHDIVELRPVKIQLRPAQYPLGDQHDRDQQEDGLVRTKNGKNRVAFETDDPRCDTDQHPGAQWRVAPHEVTKDRRTEGTRADHAAEPRGEPGDGSECHGQEKDGPETALSPPGFVGRVWACHGWLSPAGVLLPGRSDVIPAS